MVTTPGFGRTALAAAFTLLLAGCGAAPPEAPAPEQGTPIAVGETVEGVIRADAPTYGTRGRFHLYNFRGTEGERYVLDLRSSNFDSYLTVGDRAPGIFSPIKNNDDGGDGFDARLRFVAPRTGTYLVLAQALGSEEDDIGIYTLGLESLGEPEPAIAMPVTVGQDVRGELTLDDPILPDQDDEIYDLYSFHAEAGVRYVIELRSDDFDAYLHLGPMRDGAITEVTRSDDDGGNGRDSRLLFTPDATGTYGIRAKSYGDGAGDYTLLVQSAPDPGPLEPRMLSYGETLAGELELGDHLVDDDGAYYDLYAFEGEAGDEVVIDLMSEDFDTYLSLGRLSGGTFDVLETDDDGGEGFDSRLTYRLTSSGIYHLRARALGSGSTGDYRIHIEGR